MFEVAWIDNYNINSSTTNGYTYASRNLIRELSKTNLMVHTHEDYLDDLNPPKLPEGMGYFIKFDIDFVDVLINNQLPAHFLNLLVMKVLMLVSVIGKRLGFLCILFLS